MFIIYAICIGILLGYLRGGSLMWIVNFDLNYKVLAISSLFIQILLFSKFPVIDQVSPNIIAMLHILSYLLLIAFIISNIKIKGISIIGFGTLLNAIVISLNNGYMPSILSNARTSIEAGTIHNGIDANIIYITENTVFPLLADIFTLPSWLPLSNAFSIGDLFIATGTCLYFIANMQPCNHISDIE